LSFASIHFLYGWSVYPVIRVVELNRVVIGRFLRGVLLASCQRFAPEFLRAVVGLAVGSGALIGFSGL
jgi:hypothetical protein